MEPESKGPNLAGMAAIGLAAGLGGLAGTMLSKKDDEEEEEKEDKEKTPQYENRFESNKQEQNKNESINLYEKMVLNNQPSNINDPIKYNNKDEQDSINTDGLL